MSLEKLMQNIADAKEKKNALEEYISSLEEIDFIEIHFKKKQGVVQKQALYADTPDTSFKIHLDKTEMPSVYMKMQAVFAAALKQLYDEFLVTYDKLDTTKERVEHYLSTIEDPKLSK